MPAVCAVLIASSRLSADSTAAIISLWRGAAANPVRPISCSHRSRSGDDQASPSLATYQTPSPSDAILRTISLGRAPPTLALVNVRQIPSLPLVRRYASTPAP